MLLETLDATPSEIIWYRTTVCEKGGFNDYTSKLRRCWIAIIERRNGNVTRRNVDDPYNVV